MVVLARLADVVAFTVYRGTGHVTNAVESDFARLEFVPRTPSPARAWTN